ncbi:hypothetical protein U9M48_013975 [Paspalum notatum var. saurae]|uniref:Uncharacterized protein n=1 Tax=Paspalum notatum var. saurae TaxID=547442 RepID=A0AAQ3WK89_PASNO
MEGKLQIKERDKPMEMKPLPVPYVTARVPEKTIHLYQLFAKNDLAEDMYLKEDGMADALLPGGLAKVRDMNSMMRNFTKVFREFSARCMQEYKIKGYLEQCCPADANLHHNSRPIDQGK